MTCLEWFAEQDASYQMSVLPPGVRARVCVEAGISQGWHAIAGDAGEYVSLEHFGASAAYQTLYEKFGITAERVAEAARSSIAKARSGVAAPGPAAPTGPMGHTRDRGPGGRNRGSSAGCRVPAGEDSRRRLTTEDVQATGWQAGAPHMGAPAAPSSWPASQAEGRKPHRASYEFAAERQARATVRSGRGRVAGRHQPRPPCHGQPGRTHAHQACGRGHIQSDDLRSRAEQGNHLQRPDPRPRAARRLGRGGVARDHHVRHPLGVRCAPARL